MNAPSFSLARCAISAWRTSRGTNFPASIRARAAPGSSRWHAQCSDFAPATKEIPMGASAIDLLRHDHREIEGLFGCFALAEGSEKMGLARDICEALMLHAIVEDRCHAALRGHVDDGLLDAAATDYRALEDLVARVDAAGADNLDAYVAALRDWMERHVEEEEGGVVPRALSCGADLEHAGAEIKRLKESLEGKIAELNGGIGHGADALEVDARGVRRPQRMALP